MTQETIVPQGTEATSGFDALRILDYEFTVTIGNAEHTFETLKDADGRIVSVNGNGKNRPIMYANQEKATVSFAGVEYEQEELASQNTVSPEINNVGIDVLDSFRGIYRLSVSVADCTLDSQANPFFFFYTWEGAFEDYATETDGSVAVTFRANSGTGDRNVQVFACVGDGLGQTCRKSILLEGAY